jgi:hypothetical protein
MPPEFHPGSSHAGQVRLASGLNVLAGLYLLFSSWINGVNGGNTANGIIFGIIVVILAATRMAGNAGPWASWIDALIGIWVILSPWVYGYSGEPWMWNSIVVGIIILILGIWSATASTTGHPMGTSRG